MEALSAQLPEPAASDLAFQQEMLWSSGWCRDPENLLRYPRYLQAVLARVERLRRDPAKDAKKQSELSPAFDLLAAHAARLSPGRLREAFRKIEELRLNTFAPELRGFEKMSAKRFAEWMEGGG
jgi:ATP-dependent helicase HrpA